MKELASQSSAHNETRTWNEAQPVLDEAVESLPNNDRKTIILRFFEEQSFRAIGEALGKSEDTSQKQVSRALDKLGLVLSRQGFAASTVPLGTLSSSEATKAAPIALQHWVAQTNLAVVPHLTTTTLISNTLITMSYAKTKTALLVTAMAAVPMGLQWNKIQSLKEQIQSAPRPAAYAAQSAQVEQFSTKLEIADSALTKLRKETTNLLAKASASSGETASPMTNIADMFSIPAIQGDIRQQIRGQVMSIFSDLLESFDLTRPEIKDLETIPTDKLMLATTKVIKIMDKSLILT